MVLHNLHSYVLDNWPDEPVLLFFLQPLQLLLIKCSLPYHAFMINFLMPSIHFSQLCQSFHCVHLIPALFCTVLKHLVNISHPVKTSEHCLQQLKQLGHGCHKTVVCIAGSRELNKKKHLNDRVNAENVVLKWISTSHAQLSNANRVRCWSHPFQMNEVEYCYDVLQKSLSKMLTFIKIEGWLVTNSHYSYLVSKDSLCLTLLCCKCKICGNVTTGSESSKTNS